MALRLVFILSIFFPTLAFAQNMCLDTRFATCSSKTSDINGDMTVRDIGIQFRGQFLPVAYGFPKSFANVNVSAEVEAQNRKQAEALCRFFELGELVGFSNAATFFSSPTVELIYEDEKATARSLESLGYFKSVTCKPKKSACCPAG